HPEIRTLVFFPGAHIFAESDQFTRAFLFELGTDPGQLAVLWNHDCEHALAGAPAHAGEVEHGRTRLDVDGSNLLLSHQALRFCDTRLALVVADWHDIRSHAPQVFDDGGNVLALLNRFNLARVSESEAL